MTSLITYEHKLIEEAESRDQAHLENKLCADDIEALDQLRKKDGFGRLLTTERHGVRFGGYCGVMLSETGRNIEVLPKTSIKDKDEDKGRAYDYLRKMIESAFYTKALQLERGNVAIFENTPLLDTYIAIFLDKVADITHKGLKRSYIRSKESLQAVRGKMLMSKQSLRLPHQQHINHLEYDLYSYDRPENKLLAHCLRLVSRWAVNPEIRKKAQRLKGVFADIPESTGLKGDFKAWSTKRDMAYYRPAKKWVEYIIRYCSPYALAGKFEGPSLLFPTDKLFESYIARYLPSQLAAEFYLKEQVGSKHLLRNLQNTKSYYQMKPDFVIYDSSNKPRLILDAKWKIIDQNAFVPGDSDSNRMSENDLRQLYVYGHKYLDGEGDVVLIYPKHDGFNHAMPMFDFSDGKERLRLWILPYDLEANKLILPTGYRSSIIEKINSYFN